MQIQDTTGSLSALDRDMLSGISTPLDVNILLTAADSRPGLEIQVHDMVTTANTLAIGVDPVHHYVFTHFGTGTGIRKADYLAIEKAGNAEFHAGHWGAGLRAIVNSATAASSQTQRSEVVIQQPTTVVEHSASAWPFVVGFGLLAAAVLLVWRWMRRRSIAIENAAQEARDEAQELRKRNIEEQGWHDKLSQKMGHDAPRAAPATPAESTKGATVVSINQSGGVTAREVLQIAPAPDPDLRSIPVAPPASAYARAPQVVHHYHRAPMAPVVIAAQPTVYGGGNDFLTGMLVGEALERPREREVVREVVREEPRYSRSRDDDGGGGGSSWGSSDTSSSSDSFDSGGGGGGFDSGGGNDGGGGGGDF